MILTITGHRPPRVGGYNVPNRIYNSVMEGLDRAFLNFNPTSVNIGMALGVDQWAAELCIYNEIPFNAVIPYPNYESTWPAHSQLKYREILRKAASTVFVTTGGYAGWKLQARNEWMIDRCDQVVAVWDGSPEGGTANAVNYARVRHKPVHLVEFIRPEQRAVAGATRTTGAPRRPVVILPASEVLREVPVRVRRQEPTPGELRARERAREEAEREERLERERIRRREESAERIARIRLAEREAQEAAESARQELRERAAARAAGEEPPRQRRGRGGLRPMERELSANVDDVSENPQESAKDSKQERQTVIRVEFGRLLDLGD